MDLFEMIESLAKIISEYGILVIIAAVFLFITLHTMKKNDAIVGTLINDLRKKIDDIADDIDDMKNKQNMQFDTLKRINDHMGRSEGCMKEVKEMLKKNK